MTAPRQVLPGTAYMLSRRCTQRQFLLRPDETTNEIFAYCLAEAAQRFRVPITMPLAMSNHHHTDIFDPEGMVEEFTQRFHVNVAKAMNAYRGRWENFWASEQPSLVELVDRAAVIDKVVYTAMNPVRAGLVARALDWPGFSGLHALLTGEPIVTRRPAHFFREDGTMPETVTLELSVPPIVGAPAAFRDEVRRKIAEAEAKCAAERRGGKGRVLGRAAVQRQEWWSSPMSLEERRGMSPRVASRWKWNRIAAVMRCLAFQGAYRKAYKAWRAGDLTVEFPAGTYWLARFANVRVASEKIG